MAQKAKVEPRVHKGKGISLGRNFLDVRKYEQFLRQQSGVFDKKTHNSMLSCYKRCLEGAILIEVLVAEILDRDLANCTFYCRGVRMEFLFAPAECLKAIKPVIAKITPVRNEFRHLLHAVSA